MLEIKNLLKETENYGGHGLSKHHNISDDDALYYHKSARLACAGTIVICPIAYGLVDLERVDRNEQ